MIELWGSVLTAHSQKLRASLLSCKTKPCLKLNDTEPAETPEEIYRLSECLQFILDQIYRDISSHQVLKAL